MISRALLGLYLVSFFAFLFGPLVVMGVTAFNTPTYPQVWPFEGFTLDWFAKLYQDDALMTGLRNSFLIGALVVALSVPLGLAGALVMTQIYARARGLYYLVVVSPVLTPGVIVGISTVIFWKDVTAWTNTKPLFTGFFLATLGQSTFISSYCMLIFLSRLQRYDRTQEEAALDLGASHAMVMRRILLPHLYPAIGAGAAIAFFQSIENFNITLFTRGPYDTMTVYVFSKVRSGITPTINALAVILIAATLTGVLIVEMRRRYAAEDGKSGH